MFLFIKAEIHAVSCWLLNSLHFPSIIIHCSAIKSNDCRYATSATFLFHFLWFPYLQKKWNSKYFERVRLNRSLGNRMHWTANIQNIYYTDNIQYVFGSWLMFLTCFIDFSSCFFETVRNHCASSPNNTWSDICMYAFSIWSKRIFCIIGFMRKVTYISIYSDSVQSASQPWRIYTFMHLRSHLIIVYALNI